MKTMNPFYWGATAMGCLVAALFFFRFYRQSTDRLFLFFALGFTIFGANRLPQLATGIGKSIRSFKDGMKEGDDADVKKT